MTKLKEQEERLELLMNIIADVYNPDSITNIGEIAQAIIKEYKLTTKE